APRDLDASVHPGLSAVILKTLGKAPEQRYQTGAELARDLDNYKSFQEGTAKTFSGASTAPIPLGSALPSQGTEAIYSVETAAITPRSTPSKNIEAKTNVAPAVSVPPAPVSVPSALRQGERVERSGSRRRLPVVIVLLLILAGGLTYRARHEKP